MVGLSFFDQALAPVEGRAAQERAVEVVAAFRRLMARRWPCAAPRCALREQREPATVPGPEGAGLPSKPRGCQPVRGLPRIGPAALPRMGRLRPSDSLIVSALATASAARAAVSGPGLGLYGGQRSPFSE